MNERIDELLWQAGGYTKLNYPNDTFLDGRYALTQEQLDKFAELIVAECNKISKETCDELKTDESIQTPGSKVSWNLYMLTLRNKLAEHFWVEL
jgi:hypothetical protein